MRESIKVKMPAAIADAAARLADQEPRYRPVGAGREVSVAVRAYGSRRSAVVPRRVAY